MAEGPDSIEVEAAEEREPPGRIPGPQLVEHLGQVVPPSPPAHHRRAIADHHKSSARQILSQTGILRRNLLTACGEEEHRETLWRIGQWNILPCMNHYRTQDFANVLRRRGRGPPQHHSDKPFLLLAQLIGGHPGRRFTLRSRRCWIPGLYHEFPLAIH